MSYSMQSPISGLINRLSNLSTPLLFAGGLILQALIMITFALFWWDPGVIRPDLSTPLKAFVVVVIAGPLLETLIFQYAIITSMLNTVKSTALAVPVSALAFCLTHYYSPQYVVATFLSGILFAILFLVFEKKNRRGFLYVLLIHASYNFFVFIMKHWFN